MLFALRNSPYELYFLKLLSLSLDILIPLSVDYIVILTT